MTTSAVIEILDKLGFAEQATSRITQCDRKERQVMTDNRQCAANPPSTPQPATAQPLTPNPQPLTPNPQSPGTT